MYCDRLQTIIVTVGVSFFFLLNTIGRYYVLIVLHVRLYLDCQSNQLSSPLCIKTLTCYSKRCFFVLFCFFLIGKTSQAHVKMLNFGDEGGIQFGCQSWQPSSSSRLSPLRVKSLTNGLAGRSISSNLA